MVERHIVSSKCEVVSHIEDPSILKGKHVFGELPIHLASLCDSYTEIPLALTPKDNGKELTLARLRKIAGEPLTYKVILFAKNGLFC
jgi:putative CRISPR-associated protein (TIGR02620 family)